MSPHPVRNDWYITTGLQTMDITRKQYQSSTKEDGSSDDQHEDGGPSKKTASTHYIIKSPKSLPLTRNGPFPVITMIVPLGERDEVVQILLNTRSPLPLLTWTCTQSKRIPVAESPYRSPIQDDSQTGSQRGRASVFCSPSTSTPTPLLKGIVRGQDTGKQL